MSEPKVDPAKTMIKRAWKELVGDLMAIQTYYLRRENISRPAFFILHIIDEKGPQSLTMLAGILQASKPTLTSLIDNLERENLVERIRDNADRRVYSIALTRAGKKKLVELSSIYDEVVSYMAENIAQNEMSALLHTLDLMKTKLREMNENISKEDE